jgi:uncharacterized glyoxalase superfamily protein PhnB
MSAHTLPSESCDLIPDALRSVPSAGSRKQSPIPKTVGFRPISREFEAISRNADAPHSRGSAPGSHDGQRDIRRIATMLAKQEQDGPTSMTRNRSVPVNTVLPHLVYRDLPAAVAWLTEVFGFTEHYHYGEPMSGAQVYLGGAFVMLKQATDGASVGMQTLTIFIEDVEAHCARAKAGGAKIPEEPHETVYGEFQYVAEDPDGHHWLFSRHARDLSPADWGATVVHAPRQ